MSDENLGVIQSGTPTDGGASTPSEVPAEGGQVTSPEQSQQSAPQVDPVQARNAEAEGQLKALLAEREKRQLAERQADFYRQQVEAQQYQTPQAKYDPEDLASFGSVEQIVKSEVAKIQKQYESMRLESLEVQARGKYNDFDHVLALAVEIANEPGNEGIGPAIMASKNPAETAYRIGLTHPRYSSTATQKAANSAVERIANNLNTAPTLSSVNGGTVRDPGANKWLHASKDELERRIQEIKFGR